MIYYAQTYSPWRGWHMRRYPPLGRSWRGVARSAALGAAVLAGCIGIIALGAWLDTPPAAAPDVAHMEVQP